MSRQDLTISVKVNGEAENNFSDDAFQSYVREILAYPVLNAEEEVELAKRIELGDLAAKQELIRANLRLVLTVARKEIHASALPLSDLVQEGNVGLLVAAEKFDYRLGYRFATYAAWWVKQAMFKAISEQTHCMKIPVYIQETLSKYSKIKSKMEQETNANVKVKDVAEKMNISPDKIEMFLSAYSKTISIESGIEKNDGKELNVADILADKESVVPENIEYQALKNDINNVISTLKDREQEVVRMRFGLGEAERLTLEEIGNLYGVTKECIRQTEMRALKKMRICGGDLLSCYIC